MSRESIASIKDIVWIMSIEPIASIQDIVSLISVFSLKKLKWNCLLRNNNACVIYCFYGDNFLDNNF